MQENGKQGGSTYAKDARPEQMERIDSIMLTVSFFKWFRQMLYENIPAKQMKEERAQHG